MDHTQIGNKIKLRVFNKTLNADVVLERDVWYGHIIPGHEELNGYLERLVKPILEDKWPGSEYFTETEPPFETLIYAKCPHLNRYGDFLKVALGKDKDFFVRSIYPVPAIPKWGIQSYGRS